MALVANPLRELPQHNQLGQTQARTVGVGWYRPSQFAVLTPLPMVIPAGGTLTSDDFIVAGFNSFVMYISCINQNVQVQYIHTTPDSGSVLVGRTLATLAAGAGLTAVLMGAGNGGALGGQDTFIRGLFKFINTSGVAAATIDQFFGLFMSAR